MTNNEKDTPIQKTTKAAVFAPKTYKTQPVLLKKPDITPQSPILLKKQVIVNDTIYQNEDEKEN
jgi:hypothetical protein